MSNQHPKIPRGWRKLRTGSKVRDGDKQWSLYGYWRDDIPFAGLLEYVMQHELIIRRVAKKGKKT
jgi:hypothetical protein